LTATFYLTAGCLADGEPFWPAELRALVPLVREPLLRLDVSGCAVDVPLRTEADRREAIRTLTRVFKSNAIPVREALRVQLRRAAGNPGIPNPMLTWSGVAEMHELGMTIGAHTVTHPNLPSAGAAAAAEEVLGSRTRLEAAIGERVSMFSYPNGGAERYYTPELQRVVCDSGFAAAASSRNGFAGAESDLYALERIEVEERLEDLVFALEVERFVFAPEGSRR
jgi:peptidoglycan/xylan/chitin deacetylase (PgdA/CDA1 family)